MNGSPHGNGSTDGAESGDPVRLEGFGPKDLYQRREKIFTRYVGGIFQRLRFYTGWPLLVGYFAVPWLNWGERQMVLFDLPARQFHILGLTIWPQDLWLLGWLLMIAAFGLFTVTTIVGRLWCGYTCPQTVWTAIFMWMEQVAEGPRHQRMRLEQAPMSLTKVRKRAFKHAMWLGWAFLTGLTFVGYFTPIRELTADFLTLEVTGWAAFWTLFFTGATYVNAGWMREQVCKYMCPYARFQSAMFDKDTLIVSYDAARGEPRGSRKRGEAQDTLGDCIDCQLCVQVCPTGIDIRNGLQYECIGCAHCIDACAQVMEKMDYPPGLIRYTTEHELAGGNTHWLRGRSIGYAAVCVVLMVAFGYALTVRSPFAFDIIRERDTLYHLQADGRVRNDYQLKVMNKTQTGGSYTVRVASPESIRLISRDSLTIDAGEVFDTTMQLVSNDSSRANVKVEIEVCQDARCVLEETRFLSPMGSAPR